MKTIVAPVVGCSGCRGGVVRGCPPAVFPRLPSLVLAVVLHAPPAASRRVRTTFAGDDTLGMARRHPLLSCISPLSVPPRHGMLIIPVKGGDASRMLYAPLPSLPFVRLSRWPTTLSSAASKPHCSKYTMPVPRLSCRRAVLLGVSYA